jgi:hydrogenase large subunit
MVVQTPNGFSLDNAGQRIVIDPVTRIEGHMRCEVNVDEEGVIRNAVSTGTMWRGLEVILRGRDPRDAWAFTERICGVCTGTHALTSVRAVEDALGITIPENANSIRNLMQLNLQVHDHIVHFYHLHALDWVNPVNALRADPTRDERIAADGGPQPPDVLAGVFPRHPERACASSWNRASLACSSNGYWDNPAYQAAARGGPDGGDALSRGAGPAEGDRQDPHDLRRQEPAPELACGRCALPDQRPFHGRGRSDQHGAPQRGRLEHPPRSARISRNNVYIPDVIAIGGFYRNWLLWRRPVVPGGACPMATSPRTPTTSIPPSCYLPAGAIINGDLNTVHEVDVRDPEQIQEFVDHSWYEYGEPGEGKHPWDGVTQARFELGPNTVGERTHIREIDEAAKYSWIKAPRWRGNAMEVGPLARYIVGYAQGHERITDQVTGLLRTMDLPVEALFSTLGRTAARALETEYCADLQQYFFDKLMTNIRNGDESTANIEKWEPQTWPASTRGVGFTEAPRGALGHWVTIEEGRIENYQCVVPTTWNGSPRDSAGNIGAFEASLLNTPMERPEEPVEVLRTLHSFDPCLACSTHVMSPDGDELTTVKVR